MSGGIQFIVSEEEIVPPNGDIVLNIKFDPTDSPARAFSLASDFIRAFEDFDRAIISAVDSGIVTSFILEDVEKSSLRVVLRNMLNALEDDGLKTLDWKPFVGKYLVRAKYVALQWLDQDPSEDEPPKLEDLTEKMDALAKETDVRHLPDYPPINPARLAQPLEAIQRAKARFKPSEELTVTLDETEYRVATEQTWSPAALVEENVAQELSNEIDLVLTIRKPDFIGKSKWSFKHGKRSFSAAISDEKWMEEFHSGEYALKPNDALRVRARFEYKYDETGSLEDESVEIIKVFGVIHAPPAQEDML